MPAYHGPAQVTLSARHFGVEPLDTVHPALAITLAHHGPAHDARLEFDHVLFGPERANYVHVRLPNGQVLGGTLLEGEHAPNGSGWLIFHIDDGDWGLLG